MGFFKRVKDAVSGAARRVTGRTPREEAPPREAPTPPAPPTPEPSAPEEGEAAPEAAEEDAEGEEGAGRKSYPATLAVTIQGTWYISKTRWQGLISGVLQGAQVKRFLDEMDRGDASHDGIRAVCEAYDSDGQGFADRVDLDRSSWSDPQYDDPGSGE